LEKNSKTLYRFFDDGILEQIHQNIYIMLVIYSIIKQQYQNNTAPPKIVFAYANNVFNVPTTICNV
jgi:hypothetical protein